MCVFMYVCIYIEIYPGSYVCEHSMCTTNCRRTYSAIQFPSSCLHSSCQGCCICLPISIGCLAAASNFLVCPVQLPMLWYVLAKFIRSLGESLIQDSYLVPYPGVLPRPIQDSYPGPYPAVLPRPTFISHTCVGIIIFGIIYILQLYLVGLYGV